jgi:trehalose 6-phosphate phosphatase
MSSAIALAQPMLSFRSIMGQVYGQVRLDDDGLDGFLTRGEQTLTRCCRAPLPGVATARRPGRKEVMDAQSPVVELGLASAVARVAAQDRLLVASDFDGTLAPLVDDPARARALPAAETALISLAALPRTEVALVSGRSLASLRAGVGHLTDHATLIGGHGIEWEDAAPTPEETARLDTLVRALDDVTEEVPGAWVERKPFSAVVHLRRVPADEAVEAQAAALNVVHNGGYHVMLGHGVIEALVREPAKGAAIAMLRRSLEADAVVYLGDDVTDDDAFATLGQDDLGISIGPTPTGASFQVASPRAAAEVLTLLAEERARLTA